MPLTSTNTAHFPTTPSMKLSKAVLGALLVGITVQTTGCTKKDDPAPKGEQAGKEGKPDVKAPDYCPACGMG